MDLAFVLLPRHDVPSGGDIVRAFSEFSTEAQHAEVASPSSDPRETAVLEFDVRPCGTAFVAAMLAPIPDSEADDAVQFSVSAMGTGWTLPEHVAHLVVTMRETGSSTKLDRLSCFTSFLAAVTKVSGAVGVYWGNAGATHDPEFFTSVARNADVVSRLMLWTGVSVAREADGGMSFLSLGMQQLDLPDLLLVSPDPQGGSDALGTMFDLLAYVAQRGEPLPDGDTIGRTADERLSVRYVRSPADPSKEVWRVELR